jgi:hypothetical protein
MTEQERRREPKRELAQAIGAVNDASERVDAAQSELEQARENLRRSLREAHEAGASYALLARIVGTSRQYITRIIYGTGSGGAMLALVLTAATAYPAISASSVSPRGKHAVAAPQRTRRASLELLRGADRP